MHVCVCRHDDAMRALEASHEKRFFGSKVTVSVHDGLGMNLCSLTVDEQFLQFSGLGFVTLDPFH